MAKAKPGDPQVDVNVRNQVKNAVAAVRKQAKNLDDKTLSDVKAFLFEGVAVCERFQGVRQTQRTATAGGGRRKR